MGNKASNAGVLIRCIRTHDWSAVHHLVTRRNIDINACSDHGTIPIAAAVAACRFGKPTNIPQPMNNNDDSDTDDDNNDERHNHTATAPTPTSTSSSTTVISDAEVAEARRQAAANGDEQLTLEEKSQRILRLLLDRGADVNKRNGRTGQCALHCIFICDQPITAASWLLSSGANVNQACIPDTIPKKLFSRASNQPHQRMIHDIGATVLMMAAEEGDPLLVATFINAKANVNAVDAGGHSALSYTMRMLVRCDPNERHDYEIVILQLVEADANVNITSSSGIPAVLYAADFHLPRIVRLLVQAGADIYACDKNKRSLSTLIYPHTTIPSSAPTPSSSSSSSGSTSGAFGSSTSSIIRAVGDGLMDRYCRATIAQLSDAMGPTPLINDCMTLIWNYWYAPFRLA